MAVKPFFEDSDSSYFDSHGRPNRPGIYEFRRQDGMKLLYTLEWLRREDGEEPRLRVVHCNRISEFPSPAHALHTLDGAWVRWLGPAPRGGEEEGNAAGDSSPDGSAPGDRAGPGT